MREETRFIVGQLVHVDHPPLEKSAADKVAVKANY